MGKRGVHSSRHISIEFDVRNFNEKTGGKKVVRANERRQRLAESKSAIQSSHEAPSMPGPLDESAQEIAERLVRGDYRDHEGGKER